MGCDVWVSPGLGKQYRDNGKPVERDSGDLPPFSDPYDVLDNANRSWWYGGGQFKRGNSGIDVDKLPKDVRFALAKELALKKHLGWDQAMEYLKENLEFVAWGVKGNTSDYDVAGKKYTAKAGTYLMMYKFKDQNPVLLFGPGKAGVTKSGIGSTFDGSKYMAQEWLFSWIGSEGTRTAEGRSDITFSYQSRYGDFSMVVFGGYLRHETSGDNDYWTGIQDYVLISFSNGNIDGAKQLGVNQVYAPYDKTNNSYLWNLTDFGYGDA